MLRSLQPDPHSSELPVLVRVSVTNGGSGTFVILEYPHTSNTTSEYSIEKEIL